jgi:hypothetical protein
MEDLNMAPPFYNGEYITRGEADLRFEMVDQKFESMDRRVAKIEDALDEVVAMQKEMSQKITYGLILSVVMLVGILLGRGLDFGVLFP